MSARLAALCVGAVLMLLVLPSIASAAVDTIIFEDLFDLYQQDLNGQNREWQLTDSDQDDFALGPAGDKVTYSTSDQQIAIYMGGQVYTAFAGDWNTRDFVEHPHFAPDDGSLIFARSAANDPRIWDIWSVNYDGTNLRRVVSWSGNQDYPVYSPDGRKIAFTSNTDANGGTLKGTWIFVANADGTGAVKVVQGSEPTFSPDGMRLAYSSGGNLYAVNSSDGHNRVQVTRNGQSGDPDWSPDGTTIAYRKGVPVTGGIYYQIWLVNPNGTSDRQYIAEPQRSKFSPSFRQPSTTVGFYDYLSGVFFPRVYFDSSEQWRPLQVAEFFREGGNSVDGVPISDWTALRAFPSSSSTLDVRGEGSEGNYTSPYPECTSTGLRDCDSGGLTSGYYHVSNPSPGGYPYLDYWYFYRYNYFGSVPIADDFNHEADWEGVSVAPTLGAVNTFDFASFSQHGTWYSYLREVLSCDDGGQGSCGTESAHTGRRVHDHPANGTHANYGTTCSEVIYGMCSQSDGVTPERGYDGNREWGGNVVTRFPANIGWATPSLANWVDWPGKWGVDRDVSSPAAVGTGNGTHYNNPWLSKCRASGCGRSDSSTRLRPSTATRVATSARTCANWFGADVRAIACAPRRLASALGHRALHSRGSLRLGEPKRHARAASAPGIAQLVGPPLRAGGSLRVAGNAEPGTVLFVRAASGRTGVVARFALPAVGTLRATVKAVRRTRGALRLRLRLADGTLVAPSGVWTARRPKPRRLGPRHVTPLQRAPVRPPTVAARHKPRAGHVRRQANTTHPHG